MNLYNLPINWFDVLILVVLFLGMHHGRKQGISEELMGLLQWLAIVFGCAFVYRPLGDQIAVSTVFNSLTAYLVAYFGMALVISTAFAYLKKVMGGKLIGSDAFGRSEFYLGMLGGMVKFTCILIAGLALLNARAYNQAEIRADITQQNDVYGNTFFPKLYSLQAQVFERSLTGPWIRKNLGLLLIKQTAPEQKQMKQKDSGLP